MSTERERILESVARGELSPDQADALLKELARPRPPFWTWLFNPLARLSTGTALGVALAVAIASVALSRYGVVFPGAIDLKMARSEVPLWAALVHAIAWWPIPALVFWGASRLFARQGRFIDFFNAVGLARIPMLLAAFGSLRFRDDVPKTVAEAMQIQNLAPLLVLSFAIMIPAMIWFFTLLVMGYREASGLRGIVLALSFLASVAIAEILSVLLLVLVF